MKASLELEIRNEKCEMVVRRIKIWKRRGILIVLYAVVIPSVAEGSFLHCGQYHIGIDRETTPWCCVFLLSHMHRLSACKKDFSLTLEMTIREKGIPKSLKAGMSSWGLVARD